MSRRRRGSQRLPTIPHGPRRVRRGHRRDTQRSTYYKPIEAAASSARRGVQLRLLGGTLSLVVAALLLVICLVFFPMTHLLISALIPLVLGGMGAGVALILSARREEQIHQLAHTLHQLPHPASREEAEEAFFGGEPLQIEHDPIVGARATDGCV